jgi:hypothetical protein
MELVRLTQKNMSKYIGYEILFKTRDKHIVKKILGINKNSVKIDHPDLHNNLEIVSRKVYVLLK